MNIFRCPKCGKVLEGFIPSPCECGFSIPVINGIYQFTEDSPISVDGDGLKWLGYEYVGENYEPGYALNKDSDSIGSSKKLAEYLGEDKVVLDVGAGLGATSISFALAGLRTIAADISQVMLETAVKRARRHNVTDDKMMCVRMNGYKLELADNSVDAVIAVDMLHQVDHPELVIDEIKRVLKPDGYFLQYGDSKSFGYTEEQQAANTRYNETQKDIQSFYDKIIDESGHGENPFYSWDKTGECIKETFEEFISLESTGTYGGKAMEWTLETGLHKTKTRASGSKQLIPDAIHNDAWARTDEYAKSKYGEDYNKIVRYYNFVMGMKLYKLRA